MVHPNLSIESLFKSFSLSASAALIAPFGLTSQGIAIKKSTMTNFFGSFALLPQQSLNFRSPLCTFGRFLNTSLVFSAETYRNAFIISTNSSSTIASFYNCYFYQCMGGSGGAISFSGYSCIVDRCRFDSCYSSTAGGAIFGSSGDFSSIYSCYSNCSFLNSSIEWGAAIYFSSSGVKSLNFSSTLNCALNANGNRDDTIIFLLGTASSRFANLSLNCGQYGVGIRHHSASSTMQFICIWKCNGYDAMGTTGNFASVVHQYVSYINTTLTYSFFRVNSNTVTLQNFLFIGSSAVAAVTQGGSAILIDCYTTGSFFLTANQTYVSLTNCFSNQILTAQHVSAISTWVCNGEYRIPITRTDGFSSQSIIYCSKSLYFISIAVATLLD